MTLTRKILLIFILFQCHSVFAQLLILDILHLDSLLEFKAFKTIELLPTLFGLKKETPVYRLRLKECFWEEMEEVIQQY